MAGVFDLELTDGLDFEESDDDAIEVDQVSWLLLLMMPAVGPVACIWVLGRGEVVGSNT